MNDRASSKGPGAAGALATATLFAALIAVPAAFRASGQANRLLIWLALAGSAAIVCGTLAASIKLLRGEVHSLKTMGLAFSISLPVLAIFGRVLKTATHHRALGGVTFAVVGALVLVAALVASNRAWRWADGRGKTLALMGIGGVGLLVGVRFCLPLVSHAGTRTSLIDGVLVVAAAVVASVWVPHSSLQNRVLARGLWGALCLAAAVLVLASPAIHQAAREAAPVLFGPFWALSR